VFGFIRDENVVCKATHQGLENHLVYSHISMVLDNTLIILNMCHYHQSCWNGLWFYSQLPNCSMVYNTF